MLLISTLYNKLANFFLDIQSVRVRFFTTFLVNISRMGLGFIGGIIIARGLGPTDYGNYSFLLGSFVSMAAFFEMGTSSAFYTFLSRKKRGAKFYLYYLFWVFIQLILLLLLIIFLPQAWRNKAWFGYAQNMIILALLASFMMNTVWLVIVRMGESIRATRTVQLYNIILVFSYLCIISAMAFFQLLTIANLFIAVTVTYGIFTLALAMRLKNKLIVSENERFFDVINEFKIYCSPFILYSIVGFLYSFADVWLLQKFAGATQQGFYSIGLRFSVICLLATTSILNVFWKEIAAANEAKDRERLYKLYTVISRGLYFLSALGACFLALFSKEILVLLLGVKYEPGWICLSLMFLYPIHQSLGQINGSYFLAVGNTKLYSKIGIVMMMVSIPVTYFLLAPQSGLIPGLSLGSAGMAIKMVILQIISVNFLGYFLCKMSGWKFDFLYQFKVIGCLLLISLGIKWLLAKAFLIAGAPIQSLVLILLSVPVYIILAVIFVYFFPELIGLEKRQLSHPVIFLSGFFKSPAR